MVKNGEKMDKYEQQIRDRIQSKIDKKDATIRQLLSGKSSFIQIENQFDQGRVVELSNSIEDLKDILDALY